MGSRQGWTDESDPVTIACTGDLDHDGSDSASDLAAVLNAWGTPGAELNGDADTNAADRAVALTAWGACGV